MEKYFIFPIRDYWLSCDYQGYKGHQGIDIGWQSGGTWKTDVWASKSGKVVDSNYRSDSGNYVVIEHDDGDKRQWTRYLHLDSRRVNIGEYVHQGQVIGVRGSTGAGSGAHLHFQMSPVVSTSQVYNRDWCAANGIDPKPYLYKAKDKTYKFHSTLSWVKEIPDEPEDDYKQKYLELKAKLDKISAIIKE